MISETIRLHAIARLDSRIESTILRQHLGCAGRHRLRLAELRLKLPFWEVSMPIGPLYTTPFLLKLHAAGSRCQRLLEVPGLALNSYFRRLCRSGVSCTRLYRATLQVLLKALILAKPEMRRCCMTTLGPGSYSTYTEFLVF